jgi:hypothetical protein
MFKGIHCWEGRAMLSFNVSEWDLVKGIYGFWFILMLCVIEIGISLICFYGSLHVALLTSI